MADIESIITELSQSVPGAIIQNVPPQQLVARREEESDPNQSRQFTPYVLDVPRARLAGAFIITEEQIDNLPEIDPIIERMFVEDGIDALAWYRTYHCGKTRDWGIKVFEQGVFFAAKKIQDKHTFGPNSNLDSLDFLQLSFNLLQLHEYFHFVADVACTIVELARSQALAIPYNINVYPQNKFEEAIANAYAFRMMRTQGISKALASFMKEQPSPYNQFLFWTGRRAFQQGRQKLAKLMCPTWPASTGSAVGSELLFRIETGDLDYQDVPIYFKSSLLAKVKSSPLLFVEKINQPKMTVKFENEYASLPQVVQIKVDLAIDKLQNNVQNPSLHFEKVRGYGPIFTCRVSTGYQISLRHCCGEEWELLRVGKHEEIYRRPV